MKRVESVEGENRTFNFDLLVDGAAPSVATPKRDAFEWEPTSLRLELTPRGGLSPTVITDGVSVANYAAGKIAYSPASGALLAANSPYSYRFRITDSGGKTHYFPNREAGQWIVRRP